MHHALEIQEILFNIFDYLSPMCSILDEYKPREVFRTDLTALARTCRAFKEPALDVLWSALKDLSPLARCLPEASDRLPEENMYSFSRSLSETEWDILRNYTRRIRSIYNLEKGLSQRSIEILSQPPISESLFPNLHYLSCECATKTMPLLRLPFPSLVYLDVEFQSPLLFETSFYSFPEFSPNVMEVYICFRQSEGPFTKIAPNYLHRWQNLSRVVCPDVALDVDSLRHLSRMPTLTVLKFVLSETLPDSDSPLVFPNLDYLTLCSETLDPISQLLSQIRLPTITGLRVTINNYPSGEQHSFFAGVPTSNAGRTIVTLRLQQSQKNISDVPRLDPVRLRFKNLKPLMALRNLSHIVLNIACNIYLTDRSVLTLALAWPKLQTLEINVDWGWNTMSGVTPGGLVQLLQTCRWLDQIALRIDTRGYTDVDPSHVPASLGLTLPPKFSINVVDSTIKAESVVAVSTFFSNIATCTSYFVLDAWTGSLMRALPNRAKYKARWNDVQDFINDAFSLDSESSNSGMDSEA